MADRPLIGYAKLGRSMPLSLEKCGTLGGDVEMIAVVKTLAQRNPDKNFVLVGRNSGEHPADVGLPENVFNPWMYWAPLARKMLNERGLNHPNLSVAEHFQVRETLLEIVSDTFSQLNHMIMWLGQHGTSNSPLPQIKDRSVYTKPYDWASLYGSYLLHGINVWRDSDPVNRREIVLNADPRNVPKYRDTKWPLIGPILGQFNQVNTMKHERYGQPEFGDPWNKNDDVWTSNVETIYARLEVNGLVPGTPFGDLLRFSDDYDRPYRFGLFINEARREVNPARSRLRAMQEYVLPNEPDWVHGTWSAESQTVLRRDIVSLPWEEYVPQLQRTYCTLTTPSSGSGWATTKPWEAFAVGTVCFFHPLYDTQDHILADAPRELRDFLRVKTAQQLRQRIDLIASDHAAFMWVVRLQREHFERAINELTYAKLIEERLNGGDK